MMPPLPRKSVVRVSYALVLTVLLASPAAAQDDVSVVDVSALSPEASASVAGIDRDLRPVPPIAAPVTPAASVHRPLILPSLYVSFAALQVADLVLTRQGIAKGITETNPLVERLGTGAGLIAFKAGTAAASIYACEKLWKRNRAAAIAAMMAINGAYSSIVAHNYAIVRGVR